MGGTYDDVNQASDTLRVQEWVGESEGRTAVRDPVVVRERNQSGDSLK